MKISMPRLHETFKNFLPLKPYFKENVGRIILGLLCLLLVDALQLIIPLVIKRAVDILTLKTAYASLLLRQALLIVGLATLIAGFRYVWRYLIFGHSRRVEQRLRNRLYGHLQTLSLSFYQRMKTGDLMARSINDINAVRMAAGMGLVAVTDGLVLGLAAVGFMISINLKLTLLSLIPAPFVVLGTRILTRRMSRGFENVQKTFSDLTERVREAFSGIRVLKAYNREAWADQRIEREGRRYVRVNLELARTMAFFFPMMAVFTNAGLAVVIGLGGRLTIAGDITTGDFVAFTTYLNLLTWPMMAMGWVTNLIQRASASMRRINGILEEVPEIQSPSRVREFASVKGKIDVRGLSLRYPGQERPVLNRIHLQLAPGQTLALVGRVGCGKTTLLRALPRLLEVPEGTLFLDDVDVREMDLTTLRKNIGFVTQDVFIFSDTIRNNILFGGENLAPDALERVLEAADFLDEVRGFRHGFDTLLGERGITLSGGQRQRLTIARALIQNPPVLILDDALSMVDTRTEERIWQRILALRPHKTNLIVSHRATTIRRADQVIVLDHGDIVEQGTHEALLAHGGAYATLYEKQLIQQELERQAEVR